MKQESIERVAHNPLVVAGFEAWQWTKPLRDVVVLVIFLIMLPFAVMVGALWAWCVVAIMFGLPAPPV